MFRPKIPTLGSRRADVPPALAARTPAGAGEAKGVRFRGKWRAAYFLPALSSTLRARKFSIFALLRATSKYATLRS
jgi:hypothetical protein